MGRSGWSCSSRHSLAHVLLACKVALAQGLYKWRHNRVLQELVGIVDRTKDVANTKKEATTLPKFFTGVGEIIQHQSHGYSLALTSWWSEWLARRIWPEMVREYLPFIRNAAMHCNVLVQEIGLNFGRTFGLAWVQSRREQRVFVSAKCNDLIKQVRRGQERHLEWLL